MIGQYKHSFAVYDSNKLVSYISRKTEIIISAVNRNDFNTACKCASDVNKILDSIKISENELNHTMAIISTTLEP